MRDPLQHFAEVADHVEIIGRLDLDDVGAEHRQLVGAKGSGEHVREIEYAETFECLHDAGGA
jgi:hypothetical protein